MSGKKRRLARADVAVLVAEDKLTDAAISAEAGISERQLGRWKREPDFEALVQQHKADLRAAAKARSIAHRERRLEILDTHVAALEQIRVERAAAEAKLAQEEPRRAIPGGTTGDVVRRWRQVGQGYSAKVVEESEPDTALLAEVRATLKQAAIEVGDWTEKQETKHDGSASFLDALRAMGSG